MQRRTAGNGGQTGSFPDSENLHSLQTKRLFSKQYEKTFRLSLSSVPEFLICGLILVRAFYAFVFYYSLDFGDPH